MTTSDYIEDGRRYVPTKRAARAAGVTAEYISKLCREGKVLGTMHRGAWFVHEPSLADFVAETRAQQAEQARANAEALKQERARAERRARVRSFVNGYGRAAAIATLTACLAFSGGSAFALLAPPGSLARERLTQLPQKAAATLQPLTTELSNTLAHYSPELSERIRTLSENIPARMQLAASATSFTQSIAEKARNFFCRWLDCETSVANESTQQPPQKLDSQHATLSQNVKPPAPNPTARSATTSQVVVSNASPGALTSPTQVIREPVIERVVEKVQPVVQGGIDAATLDARLAALNTDLSSRMSALASANSAQTTNVYNTVSAGLRGDNFDDVNVSDSDITGSRWSGGSITGATISGGSVTATDLSGVLAIAKGGTGTSSAPTYGKMLVGNSSGTYDLVATSSLGITASGGSGADFGKTFELGSGALSPTTTVGLIIAASSTFNGGASFDRATTTNATSTHLFSTLGRFTTGIIDALTATAATITNLTSTTLTASNATTTRIDALDYVGVGRTATTTIRGDGVASIIPFASSTAVTVSGTASTSNLVVSNAFTLANLTGFLKATAGAVATALINLASDITGILPVANGGTGWANIASAAIPYGNGSSALATTTAGTPGQVLALLNGVPTWAATSTLSTISGTLGVGSGGTGAQSFSYGLLLSPGGTTALANIATSSLGLLTTNVTEGSNLYYTDARVQSFVHSSTTIPKTYAGNTFTGGQSFTGGLTSSALTLTGLNGPLDARNGVIGATTSISVLYGGTGLTGLAAGAIPFGAGTSAFATSSSLFWDNANARLGLGTTSPTALLSVNGNGASINQGIRLKNSASTAGTYFDIVPGWDGAFNTDLFFAANGTTQFRLTPNGLAMGSGKQISLLGAGSVVSENSANTGIYFNSGSALELSGTNYVGFDISTAEKMRIDSSGNLGIGNTSPTYKLDVTGLGHFTGLVDAANFIATSTTLASVFPYASSTALTVSGTASTTNLIVSSAGGSTGCAQFSVTGLISNTGTACGSGSAAFPFTPTLNFGANTNATSTALSLFGGLNASSTIRFGNAGISGFLFDSSTGFLGLGTTTPQWLLNPFSATAPQLSLSAGAGIAQWAFRNAGGNLYLATTTVAGTATTSISALTIIGSSGNVGIGTTNPGYALDVNGDVNVASGKCFRVNGVCIGYVEHLAAIYATSTVGTTTVQFGTGGPTFSNATLTLPATTTQMVVEVWGAGGGAGAGNSSTNGSAGGITCFGTNSIACSSPTISATGGGGGGGGNSTTGSAGGAGGTGSGGGLNLTGGGGGAGGANNGAQGINGGTGAGGSAPRGGGGAPPSEPNGGSCTSPGVGIGVVGNSFGGGGSGGTSNTSGSNQGAGGGGGGYSEKLINNPSGTYTFTVAAGGSGGTGTGCAGGAGGSGGLVLTVYATSSPNAAGNDYAEMFPVSNPGINAGDIVSVDAGVPVSMKLARRGDTALAGIISTAPGQTLGNINATGMRPVALSGRVPTKVNLENGPIQIGDRIALSSTPGVGMKANLFDASVGIALESYDGPSSDGTITVFIDLQRGLDINALGDALLAPANDNAPASSPDATTTATTTPSYSYLNSFLRDLFAHITAWLADAANGLTKIVADTFTGRVFKGERAEFDELCVGSACVTEAQFIAVFSQPAAAAPPTSVPSPPSEIREPSPPESVSSSTPELTKPEDELTNSEQPPPKNSTTATSAADDNTEAAAEESAAPAPANDNVPAAANDNPPPPEASSPPAVTSF